MSTDQAIMNDFAELLKENRELKERLREAERLLGAVCEGVEQAFNDNVAGANMRATAPQIRTFLSNTTKHQ